MQKVDLCTCFYIDVHILTWVKQSFAENSHLTKIILQTLVGFLDKQ